MNEYNFKNLILGQTESFSVKITKTLMEQFREITRDTNPLHTDADYAKTVIEKNRIEDRKMQEIFDRGCVVYGMLSASFLSTLAGVYLPGKYSLIHSVNVAMLHPVFVDDLLLIQGEITEKEERFQFIKVRITIRNQNNLKVISGNMQIGVLE